MRAHLLLERELQAAAARAVGRVAAARTAVAAARQHTLLLSGVYACHTHTTTTYD
jgi:hypothetical protein